MLSTPLKENKEIIFYFIFYDFLMLLQKWWSAKGDLAKFGYNKNRFFKKILGILYNMMNHKVC
jgi:hypothetical protein